MSFAQLEGKCYCCGKAGHRSTSCRHKDRPREEWAINKAKAAEVSNVQAHCNTALTEASSLTESASGEPKADRTVGWIGAHISLQLFQADELRTWVLLDNQSTTSIFCNRNIVNDIHFVTEIMELQTNGGYLISDKKCTIPYFGEVWYNKKAVTNVLSLALVKRHYRVTYDSENANGDFVVHLPNQEMRFKESTSGLFFYKPTAVTQEHSNVTTLTENKTFHTDRQFQKAKRARDFYHAMGTPSLPDLKALLHMNMIKDNPVTLEDVHLAEQIFGPDVGTLKGKTTRRKPLPVVTDYVEIPLELIKAQEDVTLAIDGMTVNSLKFLTTIARHLYYRTTHYLPGNTATVYDHAIGSLVNTYYQGGFTITKIHCDNEFRPLMDPLYEKYKIIMNYANAQEHVPEVEQNNRFLKERIRATYHRLPYVHLPRILVKYLVLEVSKKANFFPAKHGVSKYYSPRMILHQQSLDYSKHGQYSFGTYVQAHDEPQPSNTNAPRSLDCIYLRYNSNHQGGHELLHLPTNAVILRRRVTAIPITPSIIMQVHRIAEREGMPKGLKVHNRFGTLLYDSAWIAGVDYNEEQFDDDDYDEQYDEQGTPIEQDDGEELEEDLYDEIDQNEIDDIANNDDEEIIQDDEDDEANPTNVDADDEYNEEYNENEIMVDEDEEPVDANPTNVNENEEDEQPVDAEQVNDVEIEEEVEETTTRSGRVSRAPTRMNMFQENKKNLEYTDQEARVLAYTMMQIHGKCPTEFQFIQMYTLQQGIKKWGDRGKATALKEMKQLHDRVVFEPITIDDMTSLERKRAMESLIFLAEKRDGMIKARTCANGSTQREYIDRDDAASPTASTDAVLITATIDAKQGRDVMTADIPNAFVQTDVDLNGDKIIMKIRGVLVDILCEMNPEIYTPYIVFEKGKKVLYVRLLKALYGMLIASLLYYKRFVKDISTIGFKINPYDPCVANRIVNGKQHTITWHVDDLKSSHVDPKVNDEFLKWLNKVYGSVGEVKGVRGHKHDYLAMDLNFSEKGVLQVDMRTYVKTMIKDFSGKVGKSSVPWTENLFKVDDTAKDLGPTRRKEFHTFVTKGMFIAKRARQDILPAITFLSTRTKQPNEGDWRKLVKLLSYLNKTQELVVRLEADDSQMVNWHIDASFAVHKDYRSHTGGTMTLGRGVITSISSKQKVNTRSSTEAELVSVDDVIAKILWAKLFLEAQGFKVKLNIVHRDNTSSMKLEKNGKGSSGKRTRHFHIKYFYITDLINREEIHIQYCPTEDMIGDYMTKPLTGATFYKFRNVIMNPSNLDSRSVLDDMDNHKFKSSPGQNKTTPSTVERNIRDQTSETNIDK